VGKLSVTNCARLPNYFIINLLCKYYTFKKILFNSGKNGNGNPNLDTGTLEDLGMENVITYIFSNLLYFVGIW
jgi:hypothetical protein